MRRALSLLPLLMVATTVAFLAPTKTNPKPATAVLAMDRREVLLTTTMGLIMMPEQSYAKPASTFFFDDETVVEPSQMNTGGRTDLNSAFVGDYKYFPGMFPHAAGKIAANGPYSSVKDIYKIPGLTKNDIALFKKYEASFTANPPGRMFGERINNRVST